MHLGTEFSQCCRCVVMSKTAANNATSGTISTSRTMFQLISRINNLGDPFVAAILDEKLGFWASLVGLCREDSPV